MTNKSNAVTSPASPHLSTDSLRPPDDASAPNAGESPRPGSDFTINSNGSSGSFSASNSSPNSGQTTPLASARGKGPIDAYLPPVRPASVDKVFKIRLIFFLLSVIRTFCGILRELFQILIFGT